MFGNVDFSNVDIDKAQVSRAAKYLSYLIAVIFALFFAKIVDAVIAKYLLSSIEGKPFKRRSARVYNKNLDSDNSLKKYAFVLKNNVFDASTKLPKLDFDDKTSVSNMKRTSLDIDLVGTIVLNDPKRSVAAIKIKKDVEPFVIGDVIEDTAKIVSIADKRVVFSILSTGALEYIDMDDEVNSASEFRGGIRKLDDEHIIMDKGELNRALNNLNQLLLQARAVPYMENGEVVGFKLLGIKKNSLYDKLGAKNGDIIKSVNGIAVDSPTVAMQLYHQLRTGKEFNIEIDRKGEIKDINIQIR